MFEHFYLVATLFFAILFYLSIRDSFRGAHPKMEMFTTARARLRVLDQQDDWRIEGGELEPNFYSEFVTKLETLSRETKVEFICGPKVLVSRQVKNAPAGREGKTKKMEEYHPLFKFAHDNPERLQIFLRIRSEDNGNHYAVGTSPKLICQEYPHGREGAKIGAFYRDDVPRWQVLRNRFEHNRHKCHKWTANTEVLYEVV